MITLWEEDVPSASLTGRDPKPLKVVELHRWLQCRGASTNGKKTHCFAVSIK